MRSHSYNEQGLGSRGFQPANRQRRQREEPGKAAPVQTGAGAAGSETRQEQPGQAEENCILHVLCVSLPQESDSAREHSLQDAAIPAPPDLRGCTSQVATSSQ